MEDLVLVEGNNELNVQLTPIALARFFMPPEMEVRVTDGTILGMYWTCEFSVLITNQGDAPGTHTINWWDNAGVISGSRKITLQPGESYTWHLSQWVDFRRISTYIMNLSGDWEQDNFSQGIARP